MLRIKDFTKLYRVILSQSKPRHLGCYGRDPRPVQDPLRRRDREPCPPPPPPPPPPPKDDTLLWSTIAAVCVTAAFCYTAREHPEIRDWLTIYAPWFDDFLAVLFQENMTYKEYTIRTFLEMRTKVKEYLEEKRSGTPKECSLTDEKPVIETLESKCYDYDNQDDVAVCEVKPPPLLTLEIGQVERCLKEFGETMLLNYLTARDACHVYNKTVEDALENYTQSKMDSLQAAEDERKRIVKESVCLAEEAKTKMDQLSDYMACGVKSTKEEIECVCDMVKNMTCNIECMKIKYIWENDKATVLDDEWRMVKVAVEDYMQQNVALFEGLDYSDSKCKPKVDVDLLLHHTLRLVTKLQTELDDAADTMTERINQAIEGLTYDPKRCSKIMEATKAKEAQVTAHYSKLLDRQREENDKEAKKILEQMKANFEAQLECRLEAKQKSLEQRLDAMVAEAVAKERKQLEAELTIVKEKLGRVEAKLNARLKAENESRRSQELYSAGSQLLRAANKGDPRVSVQKELEAIENAGTDDDLVKAVLGGIPPALYDNGLVPQSVLKKRYNNMETVAQKVAMVELEGSPMPVYIMSWIQSLFLFIKLRSKPVEEMGEKATDPVSEDLDTFDLLQRARYHMDRDELGDALRYVAALQGASRGAANTWLTDARAHLAARQAAHAILAHAQALAVKYI